ncbi:MAG: hypothetical protein AUI16_21320 [Alphaproteobacteria bacterium 13_2_20CM_2_64_7]|nr:MAG: hypothetical protein AUI16_21320 [Alphaproteobacteria bacterium 13_2_20CM_2_64_7]
MSSLDHLDQIGSSPRGRACDPADLLMAHVGIAGGLFGARREAGGISQMIMPRAVWALPVRLAVRAARAGCRDMGSTLTFVVLSRGYL